MKTAFRAFVGFVVGLALAFVLVAIADEMINAKSYCEREPRADGCARL